MNKSLLLLVGLTSACAGRKPLGQAAPAAPTPAITLASEVMWEQLNPARGDQSPKAATLWGDRNGTDPTGFLVQFVDGFSSPPHIHNVSYRGVVIEGEVYNGALDGDRLWMAPGSYWTQPKGGAHITAARGPTIAYIEIDEGPYLVRPVADAFEVDEPTQNIESNNINWGESAQGVRVAPLWGAEEHGPRGVLVKQAEDGTFTIESEAALDIVVIVGAVTHPGTTSVASMVPGSLIRSSRGPVHLSCAGSENCVVYVRAAGEVDISGA